WRCPAPAGASCWQFRQNCALGRGGGRSFGKTARPRSSGRSPGSASAVVSPGPLPGSGGHHWGAERSACADDRGRYRVVTAHRRLETEDDLAARRDGLGVADVGRGHVRPGLVDRGAPLVVDVLITVEGPGQRPTVDSGRAGVLDRHLGLEVARPGVGDLVRCLAVAGRWRGGGRRRARGRRRGGGRGRGGGGGGGRGRAGGGAAGAPGVAGRGGA